MCGELKAHHLNVLAGRNGHGKSRELGSDGSYPNPLERGRQPFFCVPRVERQTTDAVLSDTAASPVACPPRGEARVRAVATSGLLATD
jgi:hypothetical protein